MPETRQLHGTVYFQNQIYTIGGQENPCTSVCDCAKPCQANTLVYNPSTNEFGNVLPPPPAPLMYVDTFTIGKYIYALGLTPYSYYTEIDAADGTGWKNVTSISRSSVAATAWNYDIWVIGGAASGPCSSYENQVASVNIFNVQKGQWRSGPDLLTPRAGASAAVIGNSIYVCGGSTYVEPHANCNRFKELASCERLTLNNDGTINQNWTYTASMNLYRYEFNLISYNRTLIAFGSNNAPFSRNDLRYTMDVYQPDIRDSWESTNITDPVDMIGSAAVLIEDFPITDFDCSINMLSATNKFATVGSSYDNCDSLASVKCFSFYIFSIVMLLQFMVFNSW